jgi:hypothetical protein
MRWWWSATTRSASRGDSAKIRALLLPGADRVEPARDDPLRAVDGLGLGPDAQERGERRGEAARRSGRDVVVAWNDEERAAQRAEEARRPLVLVGTVPVRQVAARDDELRVCLLHERPQVLLDLRLLDRPGVQVGDLEDPDWPHQGRRL